MPQFWGNWVICLRGIRRKLFSNKGFFVIDEGPITPLEKDGTLVILDGVGSDSFFGTSTLSFAFEWVRVIFLSIYPSE